MKKETFGNLSDGRSVEVYKLKNIKGSEVKFINYGARIISWRVPDKDFNFVDIVLGYENIETYEKDNAYMGAIIGRCANRIGGAKFNLNGKDYLLDKNDGNNHFHGGFQGFDKKIWHGEIVDNTVKFTYLSADGEGGYPANLKATVTYSLSDDDELCIEYSVTADEDTICNLTNHAYFNLDGNGSVESHLLKIFSDFYTQVDSELISDGKILSVEATPHDFRDFHRIGKRIGEDFDQLKIAGGYDSNWVVKDFDGSIKEIAVAKSQKTGLALHVLSDMPGLQFYSGNYLDGKLLGKNNSRYKKYAGFCLESQFFPDAINHKNFPQPILKKGKTGRSKTIYRIDRQIN